MRGCWFCRGAYIYAMGNEAHRSLAERADGPLCDECLELVVRFKEFLDKIRPVLEECYLVIKAPARS